VKLDEFKIVSVNPELQNSRKMKILRLIL